MEEAGQASETVFDLDEDPFAAEVATTVSVSKPFDDSYDEEDDFSDVSSESELNLDTDGDGLKKREEESSDPAHIRTSMAKLDAVLKLLYDHLQASHSSQPQQDPHPRPSDSYNLTESKPTISNHGTTPLSSEELYDIQSSQFQVLLHAFERTILQTFKSRYTQFLLFWFASLHPDFTDAFLGLLVGKTTASSSASYSATLPSLAPSSGLRDTPLTRSASASYLASFVSRARYVDGPLVRQVVSLLCTYLSKELEMYYSEVRTPVHSSLYVPFYAVAQAVFLVFCFRWRDLRLEDDRKDGEEGEVAKRKGDENDELGLNSNAGQQERVRWIPELDVIQQIIVSPLNPLKVPTSLCLFGCLRLSSYFMSAYSSAPRTSSNNSHPLRKRQLLLIVIPSLNRTSVALSSAMPCLR